MKTLKDEFVERLGFSSHWYKADLDDDFMSDVLKQVETGMDPHLEHFRFTAFRRLLATNRITDAFVSNYLELVEAESDLDMARSASVALLEDDRLTDHQFDSVTSCSLLRGEERLVVKTGMLRSLAGAPTKEMLLRFSQAGDATVQNRVLDMAADDKEVLQVLAREGRSKAIRNTAVARLKKLTSRGG